MSERPEHRSAFDTGSKRNGKALSTDRASPRAIHSSNSSQSSKTEIQMGSEEEKLLMVWYLRMRDAASEDPIVQDRCAAELLDKINFDITRSTFKLQPAYLHYIRCRSQLMDDWAQDFLDQHTFEDVLVLQLSCGLDSRCLRLSRRKDVKWIDVDGPKVTDLRQRLVPTPESGDYTMLTALVDGDDDSWLRGIPTDQPTLIIMEGLTYYLEPEKGMRLFKRLLGHFSHGSLVFDTVGSIGVAFAGLVDPIRKYETRLRWGIDDVKDFMKMDKRLVLRNQIYAQEFLEAGPYIKGCPRLFGGWTPLISVLPNYKKNGQFLRFDF